MRELNSKEVKEVSGGVLPVIGLAITVAESFGVRTLGGYLLNRAAYVVGTIAAGEYFEVLG
ncbi:MAG: hypothetical protein QGG67_17715 [Gammaproteobacteria bacterium]|jgi:hypothetical protein|nr:hypothetical protein [Gammaproteobacteria bacterium]MDP6097801.1 hypothetical protein [Gammaproteobacteria bacterium]|tara:strand:- start:9326 stop:9508 length:183 start_codon:yes stop_codon:yes gene_type:complete